MLALCLLVLTCLVCLSQLKTQWYLHRKTPNSNQRRLCLLATFFSTVLAVNCTVFLIIFLVLAGSPSFYTGRPKPFTWPIELQITIAIGFTACSTSMGFCLVASMQRYYRLCGIIYGSRSYYLWLTAYYVGISAAPIHAVMTISGALFYDNIVADFFGVYLTTAYMVSVDFVCNIRMITRCLQVQSLERPLARESSISGSDAEEAARRSRHRAMLRTKLIGIFGTGCVANLVAVTCYAIGYHVLPQEFVEMTCFVASDVSCYICLNIFLLDILKREILGKPKVKQEIAEQGKKIKLYTIRRTLY